MTDIYGALGEGVRRWVDDHGWTQWSLIQQAAMPGILAGRGALLLAPTASGKTEAALLPIVSRILEERAGPVALLYVAPLRALINDQTRRSYKLLEDNGLRAEWWHGDLTSSKRKAILKQPPHALFTTPESLDVMLSSATYGYGGLLGDVRYVLIDEIHAFAQSDRGAQLMSVLARLESRMPRTLQRVALSATAGEPTMLARWMSSDSADSPPIDVRTDTSTRGRQLAVGLIPEVRDTDLGKSAREAERLRKLADVVARHVTAKRAIVFTNSRAEAERLTVELRERNINVLIHHGSVDRELRRATEAAFRSDGPRTLVATSTLELGIDIGDLELIVQVGVPGTASSLLQRIGRSGRRGDAESLGVIYSRSVGALPQALAVSDLAMQGRVETLRPDTAAIHVLFQQVIQLIRERDRLAPAEAVAVLRSAGSFRDVTAQEFDDLLDEMLAMGYLARSSDDLLGIGPETERKLGYANYRDLYALFEVDEGWSVRSGGQSIGNLDLAYPIPEGREVTFVLAGRRWHVLRIDRERHVLEVELARGGAIPNWHGSGPGGSFEVMRHTLALLDGSARTPLEKGSLIAHMAAARERMKLIGVSSDVIAVQLTKLGTAVWTFGGTELNGYLASLVMAALPHSKAVSSAAETIVAPNPMDAVVGVVARILDDAAYRAELEASALDIVPPLGIGKFWRHFGPRTRRNVLARKLGAGNALLKLLPPQTVRCSNAAEEADDFSA